MNTFRHPLSISFLLFLGVNAEAAGQRIAGTWQAKTAQVSSGLVESYAFNADKTFEYRVNSDDGLQRIRAIGGVYTYAQGTLKLQVQYTLDLEGGTLDRSSILDSNDSWTISGGKQVKHRLPQPAWFGIDVHFLSANKAAFDAREYYRVK